MEKSRINALHRIAEFQKKLAWANYQAARNSTMFKAELLECAKVAAQNCRDTRQAIRNIIENHENQLILEDWNGQNDYWD